MSVDHRLSSHPSRFPPPPTFPPLADSGEPSLSPVCSVLTGEGENHLGGGGGGHLAIGHRILWWLIPVSLAQGQALGSV